MVKLLFLKMLRDMKKSLAAYGICLLIVGVGFCGFCVMSVAKDHLLVSRDRCMRKAHLQKDLRKFMRLRQQSKTSWQTYRELEKYRPGSSRKQGLQILEMAMPD